MERKSSEDASMEHFERSFARAYRKELWLEQMIQLDLEKHGSRMSLVIVLVRSKNKR